MAEPTTTVEIEFTAGVWTDVSAHLRGGSTKRGKSKAVDSPSPGFGSFTMRNELRQFDPEYAANISPGNVKPDKNIRVKTTYNAIEYPVFTGQIDRIVQRYDGPNNAVAVLECSDNLGKLANTELGSPWEMQLGLLQTPRAWYRLGESVGPFANERIAGLYGTYGGAPDYGNEGFTRDGDGCLTLDTSDDYLLLPPGFIRTDVAAPWQLSFFLQFPDTPAIPPGQIAILFYDLLFPYGLTVWLDSSGFLNVRTWTPGAAAFTYIRTGGLFGDVTVPAGAEYAVHITIQAATTSPYLRIYNGIFPLHDAATLIGTGSILPSSHVVVGASPYQWSVDEIMTHDLNMSTTDLQLMQNAADGWGLDNANDRITRILDAVDWPAGLRDVTTEWDEWLQRTDLKETPIAHFDRLARTAEHRTPFVERDGTFRIIGRSEHASAPYTTSQGTFGDGPGELPYVEMGDYALDATQVENVVNRLYVDADGLEYRITAVDAPSLAAGQRARSGDEITSEYAFPNYEWTLAALRAAKHAPMTPVVEGLKISPRKNPDALFPQVLGRELGDRLTWKRRPQEVGAAISRDVILEGVSHNFGPKHWETTFLIDSTDAFGYFHFDETNWDADDWRFFG